MISYGKAVFDVSAENWVGSVNNNAKAKREN